jgi:hypothetical protein
MEFVLGVISEVSRCRLNGGLIQSLGPRGQTIWQQLSRRGMAEVPMTYSGD